METVDTAFESLDLVLFENENLGTIGVPLSSIKTHLWPSFDQFHRLFLPIQRSILGTNCTPMVPKVCLRKSMMFELFNAVSHACSRRFARFAKYPEIWEYQFSCKNCSKSSNFQTLYKSIQKSYACVQYGFWKPRTYTFQLGKIWVPLGYRSYPGNTIFDSISIFTKMGPTQPTNGIIQKNMVPKWYPKFYIQKVQDLRFSTPCQPSPQPSQIKSYSPRKKKYVQKTYFKNGEIYQYCNQLKKIRGTIC